MINSWASSSTKKYSDLCNMQKSKHRLHVPFPHIWGPHRGPHLLSKVVNLKTSICLGDSYHALWFTRQDHPRKVSTAKRPKIENGCYIMNWGGLKS